MWLVVPILDGAGLESQIKSLEATDKGHVSGQGKAAYYMLRVTTDTQGQEHSIIQELFCEHLLGPGHRGHSNQ